jgi:predicted ATPase/DNA-binding SARP family transcriptional activator
LWSRTASVRDLFVVRGKALMAYAPVMEVRVLGPIEAVDDDGRFLKLGPRERLVLGRLALANGRSVPYQALEDTIWRDPPKSARKTLQGNIHRLRHVVGTERIRREGSGYRLVGVNTDAAMVEQLVREASQSPHPEHRIDLLHQAVGRFRDQPLGEFEDTPVVLGWRRRFEELEQQARGDLLEAEVAVGRHREVISDIEELVARDPTNERGWCLLTTALAVDGRQAEALDAVARGRRALALELGIEPGPRLKELEQRVLLQKLVPDTSGCTVVSPEAPRPRSHNLPTRSTMFVETSEVELLRRWLARRRVITIVGPGGAGKTRTAIELAYAVLDEFPDGAWIVELAAVAEASDVVGAAAGALSVTPQSGLSTLESVIEWGRGRTALLVVDNCEHVLEAAGDLVAAFCLRCPTITVVATSREPLGIDGEQLHRLSVLDRESAVKLFCDRAVLADSTLEFSGDDLVVVAELSDRLDRLPLAIEIAAAHVRWMSPSELFERLHTRLQLVGGRSRRPSRHQTLGRAVAWSYELLAPAAQTLFDRLSIFAGAFDLAAVEAVCTSDDLDAETAVIELGHLVDKSLVLSERHGDGTRFRLLETVRQFGSETLERRHQWGEVAARHLHHYVAVAERANLLVRGPQELEGHNIFEFNWDNLRAAHAWAIMTGDLEQAERIILATRLFAQLRMRVDIFDWMVRTIDLDTDERHPHPEVFGAAAGWAEMLDDPRGRDYLRRGIAAAPTPDHPSTVSCWSVMPKDLFLDREHNRELRDWLGHFDRKRLYAKALADMDMDREWWALVEQLESMHYHDERWPRCLAMLVDTAARVRAPSLVAYATLYQGHAHLDHDPAEVMLATAKYEEALRLSRDVGNRDVEAECLRALALASAHRPTDESSARTCRDALIRICELRRYGLTLKTLTSCALVLAQARRLETASLVLGLLAHERAFFGREYDLGFHDRIRELVMTDPRADEWLARGANINVDELATLTIAELQAYLDATLR